MRMLSCACPCTFPRFGSVVGDTITIFYIGDYLRLMAAASSNSRRPAMPLLVTGACAGLLPACFVLSCGFFGSAAFSCVYLFRAFHLMTSTALHTCAGFLLLSRSTAACS